MPAAGVAGALYNFQASCAGSFRWVAFHRQQLQGCFVSLPLLRLQLQEGRTGGQAGCQSICRCRPAQEAAADTPSGSQRPSSLWAPLTHVLCSGIARSTAPSKLQLYVLQSLHSCLR